MSRKKTPIIRFKGFSEDWVQRRLGDVVNFLNGRAYKQEELLDVGKYRVLRVGNFNTNDRWYYSNLELDDNKYANTGDLLYLWATNFGPEIWKKERVIYHYHIWKLQFTSSSIDKMYLYTWLFNDKERIGQSTNGTTMVHVTKGNMEAREFQYPKEKLEQKKIGEFFKKIDDTITLHQRKLELLKSLKKGYLQQMFPQKDEKTPRLRFANFEGYWVQRKLGDVADIIGGGTPSTNVPEYWGGNIDWYSPVEIGDRIYVNSSLKKITDLGLQKSSAHKLPIGTVLFTSRAGIGNTAILLKEGCTNQGFQSIVPHKNRLDSYFIFSRTHELKRFGETNGAGSTFVEISGKQMSRMPITLPSTDEQQKIGNFFKQLDGLITLHQNKTTQLQSIKKAYLQNMFI